MIITQFLVLELAVACGAASDSGLDGLNWEGGDGFFRCCYITVDSATHCTPKRCLHISVHFQANAL
jgi:hypothetical protein